MVKANLHLITKLLLIFILLKETGCSVSSSYIYNKKNLNAEKKESILKHYNFLADQFIINSKTKKLDPIFRNYLNDLVKINFENFYVVDDEKSFYFISPDRRLFFSKKYAQIHFLNEQVLTSFLIENAIRLEKDYFNRKSFYPNGLITSFDLVAILNINLEYTDHLNYHSVERLISLNKNPMYFLNFVQQKNKDKSLLNNLLNGSVFGLDQERHLKTYLLEKHKKFFTQNIGLDISSKMFYKFKKIFNKDY